MKLLIVMALLLFSILNLAGSDDHMKARKKADMSAKKLSLKLDGAVGKNVKEALTLMTKAAKNSKIAAYAKNDTPYWLVRDYMLDADGAYCLAVKLTAHGDTQKRGQLQNYSVSPKHIGISSGEYVCYLLKSGAKPLPSELIEKRRKEAEIAAEELAMELDGFKGDIKKVEAVMKKSFSGVSVTHNHSYYLMSPYKDLCCVGLRLAQNIHTKEFTVTNSPRVYNISHQQCLEFYRK
jgi:hypothetical protein